MNAVINAFTSQRVRPSTAARDREETISIAWAAVGGLSVVIPNLAINAWMESVSPVISGPRSSKVWTSVEPGGRLIEWLSRRGRRETPMDSRNGGENALKDGRNCFRAKLGLSGYDQGLPLGSIQHGIVQGSLD